MHRLSPKLHVMFYWCLVLLFPVFGVKYIIPGLGDWKVWKHVWRYSMFVTWQVKNLVVRRSRLSVRSELPNTVDRKDAFHREFSLTSWRNFNEEASCSNEMSFKRPRTFDRIFTCTFDVGPLERIMKFAVFRLHCFCKIL